MKNRMTILIAVLVVLGGSGLITSILAGNDIAEVLPFLVQSGDPEASTMAAEPWQAEQIFILVGFILFNLIGMAATIAIIMWFLHRGVAEVRAEPATESE